MRENLEIRNYSVKTLNVRRRVRSISTQQMKNVKGQHIFVSKYLEKMMASRLLMIQMAVDFHHAPLNERHQYKETNSSWFHQKNFLQTWNLISGKSILCALPAKFKKLCQLNEIYSKRKMSKSFFYMFKQHTFRAWICIFPVLGKHSGCS